MRSGARGTRAGEGAGGGWGQGAAPGGASQGAQSYPGQGRSSAATIAGVRGLRGQRERATARHLGDAYSEGGSAAARCGRASSRMRKLGRCESTVMSWRRRFSPPESSPRVVFCVSRRRGAGRVEVEGGGEVESEKRARAGQEGRRAGGPGVGGGACLAALHELELVEERWERPGKRTTQRRARSTLTAARGRAAARRRGGGQQRWRAAGCGRARQFIKSSPGFASFISADTTATYSDTLCGRGRV